MLEPNGSGGAGPPTARCARYASPHAIHGRSGLRMAGRWVRSRHGRAPSSPSWSAAGGASSRMAQKAKWRYLQWLLRG